MSYRYNISDIELHIDAINLINNLCKTSYSIDDITDKDEIFRNIDLIQLGENPRGIKLNHINGNFFGKYGHDNMNGMYEYAYIIAFVLGCKDFIGMHKCLYNSQSGFNDYKWYGLLKHIVEFSGYKEISDPYPDFMTYPYDPKNNIQVFDKKLCNDEKENKKNSKEEYKEEYKEEEYKEGYNVDSKDDSKSVFYIAIAGLLFIILSNKFMYKLTNKLGGFTMDENGPTEIGIVVHGLVFFGVILLLHKYM